MLEHISRHSSRKHSEDRRYTANHLPSQLNQSQLCPQYPIVQPQQAIASEQFDTESVDTSGSGCNSTSKLSDCNISSSSNNSDVDEIIEETVPELMNRETSTDDLDVLVGTITEDTNGRNEKVQRKTVLSGMNLTESSSSGSVTDSICTAYEQQQTDIKAGRDGTVDLVITPSNISITTGTTTSSNDETLKPSTDNEEKNSAQSKSIDVSTLSTMIGGEFTYTFEKQFSVFFSACLIKPHLSYSKIEKNNENKIIKKNNKFSKSFLLIPFIIHHPILASLLFN